jgi:hypothetical protein
MEMNRYQFFIIIFFTTFSLFSQIPFKEIESEIKNLKTVEEIDLYWVKLQQIDQNILLKMVNNVKYDSLSLENMIKTAMMFEIHGANCYKQNNIVPIMNLSHCQISEVKIIFWPIILQCSKKGGVIENFGGKFPAYELEAISLSFYNYSLLNQELIYSKLMNKIIIDSSTQISKKLFYLFEKQKKIGCLKQIKLIGKWNLEPINNIKENGFFEFVKMSDKSIYLKQKGTIQKLILIQSKKSFKKYKIENEQFDWYYEFNNGKLKLFNENNEKLIEYTEYK